MQIYLIITDTMKVSTTTKFHCCIHLGSLFCGGTGRLLGITMDVTALMRIGW